MRSVKNKNGFTLMELMVVIAIFAALSAMVLPNLIRWRATHQLNSITRQMQSVIQGLRFQAIKDNSLATITFDEAQRTYTTSQVNRFNGHARSITVLLPPGIQVAANFAGGKVLGFNSDGLPAFGGKADGTVTFTNEPGISRTIDVNPFTGNSRIQ